MMKSNGRDKIKIFALVMIFGAISICNSGAFAVSAGNATSVPLPPLYQNATVRTNIKQHAVKSGPIGASVVNAGYTTSADVNACPSLSGGVCICPADNSHCPDMNNKCAASDGVCPDLKLGKADPNYYLCPDACIVNRQTSGTNPFLNDQFGNALPLSDVEPICPIGYSQMGAYNLQPEYKKATGPYQLPWPMTGAYATGYPNYFYYPTGYKCGFVNQYSITYCSITSLNPPTNATPLNGTAPITSGSAYGNISMNWDYGYTNYGADVNTPPQFGATCYSDSGCTTLQRYYATQGPPPSCPSGGSLDCPGGYNQFGQCNGGYYCNICYSYSYHMVTRWVYPNICWYTLGNLVPGAGLIPASLVCGRVKQSW